MNEDRLKAVESAVAQIERQFGKGSIMRLGRLLRSSRSKSFLLGQWLSI